jgi:hypothetical protein
LVVISHLLRRTVDDLDDRPGPDGVAHSQCGFTGSVFVRCHRFIPTTDVRIGSYGEGRGT